MKRKIIVRPYLNEYGVSHYGYFIAIGKFPNGRLVYSRIENGKIVEYEDYYVQVKFQHKMLMVFESKEF